MGRGGGAGFHDLLGMGVGRLTGTKFKEASGAEGVALESLSQKMGLLSDGKSLRQK